MKEKEMGQVAKTKWTMTVVMVIAIALCLAQLGCKDARDEIATRSAKSRYENWLIAQKPFLTNVPPAAIYDYEFTTIQNGSTIRPIVDYYIKAGDWDGLLNLTFVIEIDAYKQPTRIREQTVTFIALPANRVVKTAEGKNRTQYCGLKLKPSEMEAVVTRAIGGGDFDDLRAQSEQENHLVVSRFEDTDDWKKLRVK